VKNWRFTPFRMGLIMLLMVMGVGVHADDPTTSGQKERAVSALEQDTKTDPNNAELWLHLGFAYRKLDKIDQSQNAFEKAALLNPQAKDAYFMLGLIYESKHQKAEAEKAWKSYLAVEKDPEKRAVAEKHIHHLSQ
jgi:cytochrome c-type biogenesis protein CcmH/NrfG